MNAIVAAAAARDCAGPGFSAKPLPSDEQPVIAYLNNQYHKPLFIDRMDDPQNWVCHTGGCPIGGGNDFVDCFSNGRVLCCSNGVRRERTLRNGQMLVFELTSRTFHVRDIPGMRREQ